jgi:LysR family transcriptional regulator, glycine cleavage system transcriptional activator
LIYNLFMRDLPPLIELRAFEAVARHLSFSRAASELGVTPTAISHQISMLERFCGVTLFRRRPRPVALTEAGAQLFPVIRDGLTDFASAIAAVRKVASGGPLIVTTTTAFASRWLLPRLPDWYRLHPKIPLEVIGTDAVLDLRAAEAHVAVRYARAAPETLSARKLLSDRFWPVCAPGLLPHKHRSLRPSELRGQTLIHCFWSATDEAAPTWQRWLTAVSADGLEAPDITEMTHLTFREEAHAIEAAIAGQGFALCSDVLTERDLACGALVRALGISLPGYNFYVTHVPGTVRQRSIDAFSAWIGGA